MSLHHSKRRGILAGGNWIIDRVKMIDVYPAQDALANIRSESRSNGGAPFNVLTDLARLGSPFPLSGVGLVGDDEDGGWIRHQCRDLGIEASELGTFEGAPTSYTDVMLVQSTGRRTFFHQRGANAFLGPEHFDFDRTEARIFHLGYLLLLDQLDQPDPNDGTVAAGVLRRAREAGLKTSVDVVSEDSDRFESLVVPALLHADYCILNEFEAERTVGIAIRFEDGVSRDGLAAAATRLLDAGVHEWVVIHFPEGAFAAHRDGTTQFQGSVIMPQPEIAGATGAGDAFAGGVLHGLHEGMPIDDCLRIGTCAAAACLTHPSPSDGIHGLEACLELGEQYGFRTSSASLIA